MAEILLQGSACIGLATLVSQVLAMLFFPRWSPIVVIVRLALFAATLYLNWLALFGLAMSHYCESNCPPATLDEADLIVVALQFVMNAGMNWLSWHAIPRWLVKQVT